MLPEACKTPVTSNAFWPTASLRGQTMILAPIAGALTAIHHPSGDDMTAHSHVAGTQAGTKVDKKYRPDVASGGPSGAIGHPFPAFGHFPPMIHTAPIHSFTTHHYTIACPACGVGILWNGAPVTFLCQGCGATVDGKALAE